MFVQIFHILLFYFCKFASLQNDDDDHHLFCNLQLDRCCSDQFDHDMQRFCKNNDADFLNNLYGAADSKSDMTGKCCGFSHLLKKIYVVFNTGQL